ncbi:MAG: serine/threonine protein phosphatase [Parachlamydiales bacterium]|nr:serine/threonine protein phosphatase [Parachlamydiales bacterium]
MQNKIEFHRNIQRKVDSFQSYENNFQKLSLVKKVFKAACLIFFFTSAFLISNILIFNISSSAFTAAVLFSALSTASFFPYIIFSLIQSSLRTPKTISLDQFIHTLEIYNKKFSSLDTKKYIGKLEKYDVCNETKIFVKADLHADYISLVKQLKNLRKKGFLDENFNVKNEHKNKLKLIFLGDYVDRGNYSFDTLNLLMQLKINNPNEIILIKGNHENCEISKLYIKQTERYFFENQKLKNNLKSFFDSLPLAVLIGEKNQKNKTQYTLFSHASLDPDIDLNELLLKKASFASITIKNSQKVQLPYRIKQLLPDSLKNKMLKDIPRFYEAFKDYDLNGSLKNLQRIRNLTDFPDMDRKEAKKIFSILKIQDLLLKHKKLIEDFRKANITNYNWGDISKTKVGFNYFRGAGLFLTPEIIKDYFRAVSTNDYEIKALRVGHAHLAKSFSYKDKNGFIQTYPVAGNVKLFDKIRKPIDFSELITTAPKIKDWKKNIFKNKKWSEKFKTSKKLPFYFNKQAFFRF